MPIRGTKPKPPGLVRHHNRPTHDWVEVEDRPYAGDRPALPKGRTIMTPFGPKYVALRAMTKAWWESISTMPHCVLWASSDWSFALTTAMVADAAFTGGVGAATELRNREKVLGTTVDYRRDLRIRYVDPSPELTLVRTPGWSADDYRDL